MTLCKSLFAAAVATSLLLPIAAFAAASDGQQARRAKVTVHPKRLWHGYGFLPGYRPWVNGLDRHGRVVSREPPPGSEPRYWHYGQLTYGWGYPGYYRGRWNGGSFGPCWTWTPIGMMPTCGQ